MGAGASTAAEFEKGVNDMPEDKLTAAINDLSDEVWEKIVSARGAKKDKPAAAEAAPAVAAAPPKKEEEAKAAEPKKEAAKTDGGAPDEWAKATLEAHNAFRAKHGAPPLEWSKECFELATKQAAKMEKNKALDHDNLEGPSGRHGQNCFGGSGKEFTAMDATKAWYDEVKDPGYDFSKPGFAPGTGHFTQVVWVETRYVGMAKSSDGCFIAANYLPAGNMQGQFDKMVLAEGAAMKERAPEPKLGKTSATAWSDDFGAYLSGSPFADDFEAKAKKAFEEGHTVELEREKAALKLTIKKKDGSSSTTGGKWG